MLYATSQIMPDVAVETDNYIEYAVRNMQQQLANKITEEAIKGERIVSIRNSPIIEEDPIRCAVKMTLTCKIEKLVRCKDCALSFKASDGRPVCKRNPRLYRYVAPDFFCADGKEEENE